MNLLNRYSRQIMLAEIGVDGQQRLAGSAVLIVGVGGLGCAAATYLVGAGIGRVGLADSDVVSESNLHRQVLYDEQSIGLPKTDVARTRLSALSSEVKIECHPDGLTATNAGDLIARYDIVVDCTDNFSTRILIDDTCAALSVPWVYGSATGFSGQLAVMNFLRKRRYRDLYPDCDSFADQPSAVSGVVGFAPAVIGSLQAGEVIKIIARFGEPLDGRLLSIDFKTLNNYILEF